MPSTFFSPPVKGTSVDDDHCEIMLTHGSEADMVLVLTGAYEGGKYCAGRMDADTLINLRDWLDEVVKDLTRKGRV